MTKSSLVERRPPAKFRLDPARSWGFRTVGIPVLDVKVHSVEALDRMAVSRGCNESRV